MGGDGAGHLQRANGRPAAGYDRRLARALGSIDLSRPVPDLWPQFIALGQFPALVLRGANSDLLSAQTVEAMVERHPNLRTVTVPDQGHAPLLKEPETVEAIGMFLAANDWILRSRRAHSAGGMTAQLSSKGSRRQTGAVSAMALGAGHVLDAAG